MDSESAKRLKKELAKARGTRKALEAELAETKDNNRIAHLSGRIFALYAEIESLLHRLTQEG